MAGVTGSDDRRAILARRRRFVLAALAGAGLSAEPALAQDDGGEQPAEGEPPADPNGSRPRICLSDDSIDGDLERPQSEDKPAKTMPARPPQVCLSRIPETDNSDRRHDGFYLRLTAGVGYAWTALEADSGERTFSGLAPGGALDFGVTISRGLVVGAGASLVHQPDEADRRATTLVTGPHFDYFPDPLAGLHFGARLGPALVFVSGSDGSARALGAGTAAFVGYDAFVLDDGSLGAALEAGGALAGGETDAGESFSARGLHAGLRFSVLWH
jgi:hypothetical protein